MAFTGSWANKYGYFSIFEGTPNDPTSMNYGGDCAERIENLKRRGYGLYSNVSPETSIVYWQENCHRLKEEQRLSKIEKEKERIFEIQKAEQVKIQIQRDQKIYDAGVAEAQRLQKVAEDKRLQQIKDQEITFNEQKNSGDFNETPITEINLSSGCSECTGTDLETGMTEDELGNKPINNNMKMAGIAAIGLIGLMVVMK